MLFFPSFFHSLLSLLTIVARPIISSLAAVVRCDRTECLSGGNDWHSRPKALARPNQLRRHHFFFFRGHKSVHGDWTFPRLLLHSSALWIKPRNGNRKLRTKVLQGRCKSKSHGHPPFCTKNHSCTSLRLILTINNCLGVLSGLACRLLTINRFRFIFYFLVTYDDQICIWDIKLSSGVDTCI